MQIQASVLLLGKISKSSHISEEKNLTAKNKKNQLIKLPIHLFLMTSPEYECVTANGGILQRHELWSFHGEIVLSDPYVDSQNQK